jgi:alginate O-acetyltransferase complex protein AlgI
MNLFSWLTLIFTLLVLGLARYFINPEKRMGLLSIASMIFICMQTAPHYMLRTAFILLTFVLLLIGWRLGKSVASAPPEKKRRSLWFGSISLLSPLVLFKIIQAIIPPQLIENVLTAKGGNLELGSLAPMGISYFTFRAIAYLIEIRKETIAPVGWWRYLNYVAFWPTVMAGPIERPKPFFEQDEAPRRATPEDISIGLARICSGLFKKMVLGSFFYQLALPYILLPSGDMRVVLAEWKTWELWFCAHFYYLYLYMDFAGYSDAAIGVARLFGYRIMENFRWPILATNVADFWRRWHISLTGWITDYVYIPLGGNRLGLRRAALNSVVAMALVGIWHGLSGHYALWGLYHAVFLIAYRQYRMKYGKGAKKSPLRTALSWFITFEIINLGWVLFIFSSKQALAVYAKMFFLK